MIEETNKESQTPESPESLENGSKKGIQSEKAKNKKFKKNNKIGEYWCEN